MRTRASMKTPGSLVSVVSDHVFQSDCLFRSAGLERDAMVADCERPMAGCVCCREKISRCVHHGTGWRHDEEWIQRSNVRNMLAQLNSVYEVGKLWEKHHPTRQYTAVLFARPDVRFACPFPTSILDNIQVRTPRHLR